VQEIIDERDENVEQTVSSAAQRMAEREKKYLSQQPSKAMQDAIKEATGQTYQEVTQAKTSTSVAVTEGDIERWLWDWGEQIEELSKDFPLLKDICKGLKKNQYPAAMFVAGGLMMTLMTRCTYRFYHRPEELRRLNNSTLVIGDPAFPGTKWSDNWGAHGGQIVKIYCYRLLDENGKQIYPSQMQSMYIVRSFEDD
jgi:hypothetical protein